MCGIFGIVVPEGEKPAAPIVEKATDSLYHRGPDGGGYFYDKNVALGNRRLAILDLSDDGHMPMVYGSLRITYNGELYNYLELRSELITRGHEFRTKTDTEVVLAAYKEWGKACEQHFNGMWAFAIYDIEKAELFCSRDRFGIKPFFYSFRENVFAFASEIKALRFLPNWRPKLNHEMAGDFLIHGLQHHTSQTLYDGVNQLPAGHQMLFDCNESKMIINQYYHLDSITKAKNLSFESATNKFKDLLEDAIHLHRRSDVKVGIALSGGLDSSTIVALNSKLYPEEIDQLETISYASTIKVYDESNYVDDLLKKYPVTSHKISAGFGETMGLMDEVIKAHDEPLLSASLIAQYLVFRMAKENNLKVMLDGQGADEILAGYGTYYKPFWKEILKSKPWLILGELIGVLGKHEINLKSKMSVDKTLEVQTYLNFSTSNHKVNNDNFSAYEQYMLLQGILPYLLHFDDRNSMAHSVESRVPFLDYRLVEFCLSLPPFFKIKHGVRKRILRASMREELPKSILNRYDKMGFPTPQQHWMSEQSEYFVNKISEIVNDFPKLITQDYLEYTKDVLTNNKVEHYAGIWRVISFFRWMELEGMTVHD